MPDDKLNLELESEGGQVNVAERVGFEPTCRLLNHLISSQRRYGHFGTSPDSIFKDGGQ